MNHSATSPLQLFKRFFSDTRLLLPMRTTPVGPDSKTANKSWRCVSGVCLLGLCPLGLCLLGMLLFASPADAQATNKVTVTPEQEASALGFAKEHHRELHTLLLQLREMDRRQYQSAIEELSRTNERLARSQERQPDRYASELEIWKIDSRVRLLVARSVAGMEEETRAQLKSLLIQRNLVRTAQLKSDHEKLQERLTRLQEQITQLEDAPEEAAERELQRLMRSVRSRPSVTPPAGSRSTESPRLKTSNAETATKPVKQPPTNSVGKPKDNSPELNAAATPKVADRAPAKPSGTNSKSNGAKTPDQPKPQSPKP